MMAFLLIVILLLQGLVLFVCTYERRQKESEYYTDYVHKRLILRVYKPEFEYQAIGKIPIEKILDQGTLSPFYKWALIEY